MQKRFGVNEPDPTNELTENAAQITKEEQAQKRQEFLQKIQMQRAHSQSHDLEYER